MRLAGLLAVPALAASGCAGETGELASGSAPLATGTATAEHPASAYTYYGEPDGEGWVCNGTLVAPHVLLTSAGCLPDDAQATRRFWSYFGSTLAGGDPAAGGHVDIAEWVAAPGYSIESGVPQVNFALALLDQPAPVPPVRFAAEPRQLAPGLEVRVVSWGATSADVDGLGSKRMIETPVARFDDETLHLDEASLCNGDAGSGVYATLDGVEQLIGVTSYSRPSCHGGAAGRIDRVAASFIEPTIAELDPDGGCLQDGACNALCGGVDEDCDGTEGDAEGQPANPGSEGVMVGGCAAGGGAGAPVILLPVALVAFGRRRGR